MFADAPEFEEFLMLIFLSRTSEPAKFESTFGNVLCGSPSRPFAPQSEGRRLQFRTHQMNHLSGSEAELYFNGVKAGAIFPRHLNDAVNISLTEVV